MAGYKGKSMSNNAVAAYESGEMPRSKWTKKAMIAAINDYLESNSLYLNTDIFKLNKEDLFYNFFTCSSWHHTGEFYNCTDFYSIDEQTLAEVTQEEPVKELAEPNEYRAEKIEKKNIEYSFFNLYKDEPELFEHDDCEKWNGRDELRFIGGEMRFFYSINEMQNSDASEYKKVK